ncbi:DUF202 domain-containing protein [Novilysobacter selenitireducens]|uniref:DUF202 domain-containing protein n=1 Tax=Novilysobacter selenitireducens TaxID=2872639 RepID=A0ABS7T5H8_9GAMM|nr:DUF202 domain-containing protein [Lysobacter selenitireducens]MBZ4039119.1 DUF202 domain-containing protein [Lysobacter selenitireducens]
MAEIDHSSSDNWIGGDRSTELSSHRTGMSFERTRMSADRTLMSILRTSLSLIGFGFTIFQFFRYLALNVGAEATVTTDSAKNFGLALVLLGELLLALGIWRHIRFMLMLRREHAAMEQQALLHGPRRFEISVTLVISILLLAIGVTALSGMVLRTGPFD